MTEITKLLSLLKGSPSIVLIITLLITVIYFIRQVIQLRAELQNISRNSSQSKRDSVIDAWEKIKTLESHGLASEDFERAKMQILSTINTPLNQVEVTTELQSQNDEADSVATSDQEPEVSRLSTFFEGLMGFGFYGVWSMGWGFGMGSFALGAVSTAWTATAEAFSADGLFSGLFYTLLLVVAVLFSAGLWLLPTLSALVQCILSGLQMVSALISDGIRMGIRDKIEKVREKIPLA